jgi:hypothetical protein
LNDVPDELIVLLESARVGSRTDRINYRDRIAVFGTPAINALIPWLRDRDLAAFAVRTINAARPHDPDLAYQALTVAATVAPEPAAGDAREMLGAIGNPRRGWPRLPAQARAVAFVGEHPYSIAELVASAPAPGLVVDVTSPTFIDTVIIGWDCDDIEQPIAKLGQAGRPPRFIPQEGWIALILFGRDWWLDAPEAIARFVDEGHPLGKIEEAWLPPFPWPGTEADEPSRRGDGRGLGAREISDLRELGYQITGLSRSQRWQVLTDVAVPRLGLQRVAEEIASFVRLRRLQDGGSVRYAYAIGEWEHDLSHLRASMYAGHAGRFPWPSTEAER